MAQMTEMSRSPADTNAPHVVSGKDKSCLVCGDKTMGYNFNALSCESCKAFFRRNAHKVIRGRCQGQCHVTVESRAFCKKCRLKKCFTVGMRKDMILTKEEKDSRRQKIIINKIRRTGVMDAEDIYSATERDLLYPITPIQTVKQSTKKSRSEQKWKGCIYSKSLAKHRGKPVCRHRLHHPHISLSTSLPLCQSSSGNYGSNCSCPETNVKFESCKGSTHHHNHSCGCVPSLQGSSSCNLVCEVPWEGNSLSSVDAALQKLCDADRKIIEEVLDAMKQTSFLTTSASTLTSMPNSVEEFVNVAETFVRKMIRLGKSISFFKLLPKTDQITLLKCSVVDLMMLRSAVNYDPFTETWSLNTRDCLSKGSSRASGDRIGAQLLTNSSPETKRLFLNYSKFIKSLMRTIQGDLVILQLLIVISLFSDHDKVQEIQENYGRILELYIKSRFDDSSPIFARSIMRLTDLRNIHEFHSNMLKFMKLEELEPLLLEIFDFPVIPNEESPAKPPEECGGGNGGDGATKQQTTTPPHSKCSCGKSVSTTSSSSSSSSSSSTNVTAGMPARPYFTENMIQPLPDSSSSYY